MGKKGEWEDLEAREESNDKHSTHKGSLISFFKLCWPFNTSSLRVFNDWVFITLCTQYADNVDFMSIVGLC